jgi:hypothetical protein
VSQSLAFSLSCELVQSNGSEAGRLACIGSTIMALRPYYDGLPSRHHHHDAEPITSLTFRLLHLLPREVQQLLIYSSKWASRRIRRARRTWSLRGQVNLHNGLILVWALVLWWGEWAVFRRSMEACEWGNWESWVCFACLFWKACY